MDYRLIASSCEVLSTYLQGSLAKAGTGIERGVLRLISSSCHSRPVPFLPPVSSVLAIANHRPVAGVTSLLRFLVASSLQAIIRGSRVRALLLHVTARLIGGRDIGTALEETPVVAFEIG